MSSSASKLKWRCCANQVLQTDSGLCGTLISLSSRGLLVSVGSQNAKATVYTNERTSVARDGPLSPGINGMLTAENILRACLILPDMCMLARGLTQGLGSKVHSATRVLSWAAKRESCEPHEPSASMSNVNGLGPASKDYETAFHRTSSSKNSRQGLLSMISEAICVYSPCLRSKVHNV